MFLSFGIGASGVYIIVADLLELPGFIFIQTDAGLIYTGMCYYDIHMWLGLISNHILICLFQNELIFLLWYWSETITLPFLFVLRCCLFESLNSNCMLLCSCLVIYLWPKMVDCGSMSVWSSAFASLGLQLWFTLPLLWLALFLLPLLWLPLSLLLQILYLPVLLWLCLLLICSCIFFLNAFCFVIVICQTPLAIWLYKGYSHCFFWCGCQLANCVDDVIRYWQFCP